VGAGDGQVGVGEAGAVGAIDGAGLGDCHGGADDGAGDDGAGDEFGAGDHAGDEDCGAGDDGGADDDATPRLAAFVPCAGLAPAASP
jgi:hypothetical protein